MNLHLNFSPLAARSRAFTAFLLAITYFSSQAQSQNQISSFRGIDLGSELVSPERSECPKRAGDYIFPVGEDFKKLMAGRQCWASFNSFSMKLSSPLFVMRQIHNVDQLPGMLSTVGTIVQDGRIEAMESLFGRESYLVFRDAMVEKYGPYDKEERVTLQNRLGATFFGRRATWTRPGSLLQIDEVIDGNNLAAISIFSKKYLDSLVASRNEQKSNLKNGL